ncbi:hypothetical protein PC122_g5045 [Phytophthora cactorum]|nr:hypothetical protein PC122_g5045 [Phytophthora cactorum]
MVWALFVRRVTELHASEPRIKLVSACTFLFAPLCGSSPNISKAARDFYAVPKNPHKSIHYNASGSETGPAASMTFLAP